MQCASPPPRIRVKEPSSLSRCVSGAGCRASHMAHAWTQKARHCARDRSAWGAPDHAWQRLSRSHVHVFAWQPRSPRQATSLACTTRGKLPRAPRPGRLASSSTRAAASLAHNALAPLTPRALTPRAFAPLCLALSLSRGASTPPPSSTWAQKTRAETWPVRRPRPTSRRRVRGAHRRVPQQRARPGAPATPSSH